MLPRKLWGWPSKLQDVDRRSLSDSKIELGYHESKGNHELWEVWKKRIHEKRLLPCIIVWTTIAWLETENEGTVRFTLVIRISAVTLATIPASPCLPIAVDRQAAASI